jgi:hypothetical protein
LLLRELLKLTKCGEDAKVPRYFISTAAESLTAATAKTILLWIAGATRRFKVLRISLGGASVTATDTPMLVEVINSDQSTAGTSTSVTPAKQDAGETAAIGTAARTFTAEPTTLTVIDQFRVSPIGNTLIWELPKDREYFRAISTSCGLRLTSAAAQSNLTASMLVEE